MNDRIEAGIAVLAAPAQAQDEREAFKNFRALLATYRNTVIDATCTPPDSIEREAALTAISKAYAGLIAAWDIRPAATQAVSPPMTDERLRAIALEIVALCNTRAKAHDVEAHPMNDKFGDDPCSLTAAAAKARECRELARLLGDVIERELRDEQKGGA